MTRALALMALALSACDPGVVMSSAIGATGGLTVTGYAVLSGDASYTAVVVESGGTLAFDPTTDTHLTVTGSIVVKGTLRMEPQSRSVEHRITFAGVDESRMVGGGMEVLASDVGLWVVGSGRLDLHGDPVTSWTRDPDTARGWDSGEILVAPTEDFTTFLLWSGGALPVGAAGIAAEAFNLTRNVVIEGTPGGRAHVTVMSAQPQSIWYAEFRHLGPTGVKGRYPLHLHHMGDAARGTRIEGVAIHSVGNHALVVHASHGVRVSDVVMYDVTDHAFWWDPGTANATHDVQLDHVLAAYVVEANDQNAKRLRAFHLAEGFGNSIVDSAAVAVQGTNDAAGFGWASHAASLSEWVFRGNVSHNNVRSGTFVWQNTGAFHLIEDSILYSNGDAGINHGAYVNSYEYRDVAICDSPVGIRVHASSNAPTQDYPRLTFDGVTIDGAVTDVEFMRHNSPGGAATRFVDCGDLSSVALKDATNNGEHPTRADFVRCGLEPGEIDASQALPGFEVRVQAVDGSAYRMTANGVEAIQAFE